MMLQHIHNEAARCGGVSSAFTRRVNSHKDKRVHFPPVELHSPVVLVLALESTSFLWKESSLK